MQTIGEKFDLLRDAIINGNPIMVGRKRHDSINGIQVNHMGILFMTDRHGNLHDLSNETVCAFPADARMKPCPFCGGEPEQQVNYGQYISTSYYVQCRKCRVCTPAFSTAVLAVELWDKRA